MRFVSLFSGIEAASVAWAPLGFEAVAFSEIEPFPCAVLSHRFPEVPNLGDIKEVDWYEFACSHVGPDIVVGGSPCQSFSVAGRREGLKGASGLMWEYVRAVSELRPRWAVWENVPGALSSSGGEDFRCLLRSLDELGYCLAWRVLDAQFFGVAQRRRRVFLIASLGFGGAVEVLFDEESMPGSAAESKGKRAQLAASLGGGASCAGFRFSAGKKAGSIAFGHDLSPTLTADWHAPAVIYGMAGNIVGREPENGGNGTGFCDPDENGYYTLTATDRPGVAVCMADAAAGAAIDVEMAGCLKASNDRNPPIVTQYGDVSGTLTARFDSSACADRGQTVVACGSGVRRLTPRECERLQGFPDDWTRVPYRGRTSSACPDGPRYKAIGNSMAIPVVRWIGRRIAEADAADARRADDPNR